MSLKGESLCTENSGSSYIYPEEEVAILVCKGEENQEVLVNLVESKQGEIRIDLVRGIVSERMESPVFTATRKIKEELGAKVYPEEIESLGVIEYEGSSIPLYLVNMNKVKSVYRDPNSNRREWVYEWAKIQELKDDSSELTKLSVEKLFRRQLSDKGEGIASEAKVY